MHYTKNTKQNNNIKDIKLFGFWIYLMSDCILFAVFFISYLILKESIIIETINKNIFKLSIVFIETCCLLFSSLTYDMAMLAAQKKNKKTTNSWLIITFIFGLSFINTELYELHHLICIGCTPWSNAFFSGFFALISSHGLHVIAGLIWIILMIIHITYKGINHLNYIRLQCLSLFWHFLDIIWIIIFTVVYLMSMI